MYAVFANCDPLTAGEIQRNHQVWMINGTLEIAAMDQNNHDAIVEPIRRLESR